MTKHLFTKTLKDKKNSHYLQIKFAGGPLNRDGIGAWADIYYDNGKHQVYENSPYRGYLSSIQNIAHFGLGKIKKLDSVVIRWNNNQKQILADVKADQLLSVNISNAHDAYTWKQPLKNTNGLFEE